MSDTDNNHRLTATAKKPHAHFVQTDRATHEEWAKLCTKHPAAAALLHSLAAQVEGNDLHIATHKELAGYIGASVSTVKRALKVLEGGNWIGVYRVGPTGSICAYSLNYRVAWTLGRDQIPYARVKASINLNGHEQPAGVVENTEPLKQIPQIQTGEQQLPTGEGLPPVSQPSLAGLEPDLPSIPARPPEDE